MSKSIALFYFESIIISAVWFNSSCIAKFYAFKSLKESLNGCCSLHPSYSHRISLRTNHTSYLSIVINLLAYPSGFRSERSKLHEGN